MLTTCDPGPGTGVCDVAVSADEREREFGSVIERVVARLLPDSGKSFPGGGMGGTKRLLMLSASLEGGCGRTILDRSGTIPERGREQVRESPKKR
jgi:hypothetical protein